MGDIGKGYGCGAAMVIAAAPVLPLLFVLGWSGAHCEPIPSCQRSAEWHIGLTFVGVLLFAATVGYFLRQLLNGMATKRSDGGYAMTFSATATAVSLVTILAALALLYTIASLH